MSRQRATSVEEYKQGSLPEAFRLIGAIEKKLDSMQRRMMQVAGLTPPQYVALSMLWEADERPLKELADGCQCTRATVTGIVDTLERKGLVTREPNPGDRRSILAKLTEKGRALQESAPSPDQMFGDCCNCLEPKETQQLIELLNKLNDGLAC
jgi:DNA-binding MarR family transcriptional regulator